MIDVHLISHTHWDREWYLTREQFRLRLVDLVDRVLEMLRADSGYAYFHLDGQTIVLEDYLELHPENADEIRGLIRSGRLLVGPWYVMFRSIGWDNTYTALVLTHVALHLPIGIAVMSVFVRDIPLELEEAARLDGCTTPQMLWRIVFPLVKPGLAATGILVFVFSWNEFAVGLTLSGTQSATVPVAIAKFAQEYEIKYGVMAAGALMSTVPAIALLLVAQRHIVKGLTAGSAK